MVKEQVDRLSIAKMDKVKLKETAQKLLEDKENLFEKLQALMKSHNDLLEQSGKMQEKIDELEKSITKSDREKSGEGKEKVMLVTFNPVSGQMEVDLNEPWNGKEMRIAVMKVQQAIRSRIWLNRDRVQEKFGRPQVQPVTKEKKNKSDK
jgi:hypothetical protein